MTPIGEIKYSNILLWCDGTDDLDLSTMHLKLRVLNCLAILSKIRMLLAKKCFVWLIHDVQNQSATEHLGYGT